MKITIMSIMLGIATVSFSQLKDLKGTWKSEKTENLGDGTFATRVFVFNDNKWELNFILYLDSLKSKPVFNFKGVGTFKIESKSKIVEGASNAIFYFDKKYLTALTDNPEILKNFGFVGLQKNKETDITENGFSFFPSKAKYGQEYDLVSLKGSKLYLGARSNDLSSEDKRPKSLGNALIKK